ncbi:hypothetical protein J1605_020438 [Eschrichtius robustus]|uniref:RRM domain-containing protein n=1 Tax=Eschrichtius robustus TaxID=9764 RepID=A0AB34HJ30_ESCRO|nr:hypothetical protein J1605_020438 [Eschrichtius robustus]
MLPASTWSDGGSVRPSYWLVLHNLTPQIDGSTLRTICMQHGPLLTFHLNLTQGTALIRYSTKQEAAKAQTALHMCVLGNTTILAEFATDDEVSRFLAQAQPPTPAATPSAPAAAVLVAAAGPILLALHCGDPQTILLACGESRPWKTPTGWAALLLYYLVTFWEEGRIQSELRTFNSDLVTFFGTAAALT